MSIHELKTWPDPYAAILDGLKRFEVRKNDRGFAVGDELRLREWCPDRRAEGYEDERCYTGREMTVRVTYLVPGGSWGLPADLCVMGIAASSPHAEGFEKGRQVGIEEALRAVTPTKGKNSDTLDPATDFYPFLGESKWDLLRRAQERIRALSGSSPDRSEGTTADGPPPANTQRLRCWRCRREFVSAEGSDPATTTCPACQTQTLGLKNVPAPAPGESPSPADPENATTGGNDA